MPVSHVQQIVLRVVIVVVIAPTLSARTWYVDDDAPNDPGPQSPLVSDPLADGSLARPFDSIAEAIVAASTGDEIILLDGIFQGPGNRDLDFSGKDLVLRGQGGPLRCIVNAQAKGRVFDFHSGETSAARVVGVTLANGSATTGGAVRITGGSTPTIERCVFMFHRAENGAAIHADDGGGTLLNSILYRNVASGAGGVLRVEGTADMVVSGCTLTRNSATSGAGASVAGSASLEVRNSILWDDDAANGPELQVDSSGVLNVDFCDVEGGLGAVAGAGTLNWGLGNLNADPLFANARFSDYHIRPTSPCTDAGDPGYVPAGGETETDDEPRLSGTAVDIGTDEIHCGPALGLDCNGNGIPDECEHDCNNNGIPDDCDIASGFAVDLNADRIPDSCHPWIQVYIDDDAPGDPGPGDPTISDPLELGLASAPFDTIQEGLDAAMPYDRIRTRPGVYRGVGNRDNDFRGKNPRIVGITGPEGVVIDAEGLGRGFHFHSGENEIAHVTKFTVRNGNAVKGGAILTEKLSQPAIVECIFHDNAAQFGGALALEGGDETVRNCVMTANTASVAGGAVWVANAEDGFVRSCTIFDNSASVAGGAIAWDAAQGARLRGCIIWDNSAPTGEHLHLDNATELAATYCNVQGGVLAASLNGGSTLNQGSNIDADPLFKAPGDYHIRVGSPCVAMGAPFYVPQPGETDVDGEPRLDGIKDIGADELVCQTDIGFGGPGNARLEICGHDLSTPALTSDLLLSNAPPDQAALLLAGLAANPTPFKGGLLVPVPWIVQLVLVTDGAGEILVPDIPGGGGPVTALIQVVISDPGQAQGFGISNAVELAFP